MTETNAITVGISGQDFLDHPDSCGKANHMWKLRVVSEDGDVLPTDAVQSRTASNGWQDLIATELSSGLPH